MTEVDTILAVEHNNCFVKWVNNSKIAYEKECKKMDDLLIQYHQSDDIDKKNDFSNHIMEQKRELVKSYGYMVSTEKNYGHKIFDGSMMQKNRFDVINKELIQKVKNPSV